MKSLKQIIDDPAFAKASAGKPLRYISREFQDYGYRLAAELSDLKHKSLYIKLAKTIDRAILEQCRRFVIDSNADNKGAMFMWKLKELTGKKSGL